MFKRIELLAPAGDVDALHAAVENGADAVYLGGKLFNARQSAGNFDMEELKKAAYYAHVRGVGIYLTLNTLIADSELQEALSFAGEAWLAGVDGIIVQDLGLACSLHNAAPEIPLHASTQMTIYDLDGVRMLEKMGFKRVVPARELSLEEIKTIAAASPIEVEIFIHGALCVCYSGECLMSSLIGSRSGNRGKCAQPCRLPYRLVSGQESHFQLPKGSLGKDPAYLMSPKDLCSLELLCDIAASGVKSLKIEGRMKSPEYVATVVRIYRKYLDMALELVGDSAAGREFAVKVPEVCADFADRIEGKDLHDLSQIFNRGGFTKGYMAGKTGADMMSYESPKNRGIYLGRTIAYDRAGAGLKLKLEDGVSIGDGVEVLSGTGNNPGTIVTLIKKDGKNVKQAVRGDTAVIGNITGSIMKNSPVYKTSDKSLNEAARESFAGRIRRREAVNGIAELLKDRPFLLKICDDSGNEVSVQSGILPEIAVNRPLSAERLKEQIEKTGQTPFEFRKLEVKLDEGLTLPVSEINEARRKALEQLVEKRAAGFMQSKNDGGEALLERLKGISEVYTVRSMKSYKALTPASDRDSCKALSPASERESDKAAASTPLRQAGKGPRLSLYLYKWDRELNYSEFNVGRLYLPLNSIFDKGCESILEDCREKGIEVYIWLPAVTRGNYDKLIGRFIEKLAEKHSKGMGRLPVDGILAGNPGTVNKLADIPGLSLAGDHSLNIFNRFAEKEAAAMGLQSVMLSFELSLGQTLSITAGPAGEVEAAVYGRLPLMTSEYCPVGSVYGGFKAGTRCGETCKQGTFLLKDRMEAEFPIICDRVDCRSTILNSTVLFVPDVAERLARAGVSLLRLYIHDEPQEKVGQLVAVYNSAIKGRQSSNRLEKDIESIKPGGYTKGHYFRGV